MSVHFGEVSRNASDIVRKLETPLDGVGVLFGLITLRLEDRHFEVGAWPAEARWEQIGEAKEKTEAIREAVSALEENSATETLGQSLSRLGLADPDSVLTTRGRQDENVLEELVDLVERTDVLDLSPSELSQLSDELLYLAGDMSPGGEFFTPSFLSDLIASLLGPTPGDTVYDPTAGTGSLLLAIHRRASGDSRIYGQEINPRIAAVARINARLHGVRADIRIGDTLKDPKHLQDGSPKTFDVVVANPPTGLREQSVEEISETLPERFQFGPIRGGCLDTAFLQHGLSSMAESGSGAFVLAPGLLQAPREDREVMKGLLEADLIQAVIQLPSGVLPNTSLSPVLMLFNRSKAVEREGRILLVDAREECRGAGRSVEIAQNHRDKITGVVDGAAEVENFSIDVSVDEILQNECNLNPVRYILDREITHFLEGFVEWRELQDIATIESSRHVDTKEDGEVPILTPQCISNSHIQAEAIRNYASVDEADGLPEVMSGDLILDRTGQRGVGEVESELSGARSGKYTVRIRLDNGASDLRSFLVDFLNSEAGFQLLNSRSVGGHGVIPITDVRELPVPVPGPEVLGVVDKVHEVEEELVSQIEEIGDLRDRLFDLKGEEDQNRKAVRELSATAEVLNSSLFRAKDLDYRVRNFYPFPLAYTYRNLRTITDPAQQHREILRIVENVVAFLASVGLAVGRCEGLVPMSRNTDLDKEALRSAWRGGIALGTWKTLAHSVADELHGESKTDLGTDYASIWFSGGGQSEFDAQIDRLISMRNDASHGRGRRKCKSS